MRSSRNFVVSVTQYEMLFVLSRFQVHYLILRKEPPGTALEVLLGQAGVIYAVEFLYGVTQVRENTAYDAVATRVYLYADLFLVVLDV